MAPNTLGRVPGNIFAAGQPPTDLGIEAAPPGCCAVTCKVAKTTNAAVVMYKDAGIKPSIYVIG
jgi:hypothetical protein